MVVYRVWDSDRDHVQLGTENVFYTYSRGAASSANIDSMVQHLGEFARQSSLPLGYVLHVAEAARPPSVGDGRRVSAMFKKHATRLSGVALVVEASGLAGATLRSAVATLFILNREGFKTRTFASVGGAAGWLGHLLRTPAADIVALSEQARVLLAARTD